MRPGNRVGLGAAVGAASRSGQESTFCLVVCWRCRTVLGSCARTPTLACSLPWARRLRRTKSAAEDLQKSTGGAERLQQLKEQAAAATSTLGERVQQAASSAQQLAKETVEELKKQSATGASGGSAAGGASAEQQQAAGESAGGAGTEAGSSSAASGAGHAGEQQQQQQGKQAASGPAGGASAAAAPGLAQRLKGFASAAAQEIARVVQSEQGSSSALRGSSAKAAEVATAGTDALAVSKQQQSAWQRQFEDMAGKVGPGWAAGLWRHGACCAIVRDWVCGPLPVCSRLLALLPPLPFPATTTTHLPTLPACLAVPLQLGSHPFFARMRGLNLGANPVFSKGREAAESIRERWETSDSPLVHRIQVGWQGRVGRVRAAAEGHAAAAAAGDGSGRACGAPRLPARITPSRLPAWNLRPPCLSTA